MMNSHTEYKRDVPELWMLVSLENPLDYVVSIAQTQLHLHKEERNYVIVNFWGALFILLVGFLKWEIGKKEHNFPREKVGSYGGYLRFTLFLLAFTMHVRICLFFFFILH
jgi:hypothetical protein